MSSDIHQILEPYKLRVEQALRDHCDALGPTSAVREACEYALMIGGKRLRPAIVYMIADALGYNTDVTHAALCVEYLHTASLIADDLPCMDNDDERRNHPSTHKAFNETIALLASYALIAAGYRAIYQASSALPPLAAERACALALENVSWNTGLWGITGGQYLDLYPPDLTADTVRQAIHQKTSTLFEISFVLGWLFGGGEVEKLPLIKRISSHVGMIFQMVDDFDDCEEDRRHERKVNSVLVHGEAEALRLLNAEADALQEALQLLQLQCPVLQHIISGLLASAEQACKFVSV
jgi:geranylgeranyl diphosphate synthase type II